jgi:small-conductance mechanosensitive channel
MTLKDILEYNLIKTDNLDISVYHILEILLIILATRLLIWVLKKLINRKSTQDRIDRGTAHSIIQIVKYILWVIAISISIETIGIKITILLAGSAALLVGLGLGLQEIFKDLVSGFFMLFEGNLKVDDIIELEGNIVGKVVEINLRTTKIETRDRLILIIPNSKFISDRLINWSHMEKKTRFHVDVGVAYGSDVEKVTSILKEVAMENPKVVKEPPPLVMFSDFGESSLNFRLHFWTYDTFWVEITKSDLRYAINRKFFENNVTIPFPQRDIHIKPPPGSAL